MADLLKSNVLVRIHLKHRNVIGWRANRKWQYFEIGVGTMDLDSADVIGWSPVGNEADLHKINVPEGDEF